MVAKWISQAFTGNNSPAPPAVTEKFIVLLMYGKNSFGDKIYSYLKTTLADMERLKAAVLVGKGFNPSDFGTVIAAGRGEPPEEVRAEIASMYQILDTQQVAKPAAAAIPDEKKNWDEY